MLRTIKEEWTDFVRKSYEGVPIGNTQYDEVRRAFYAGALVMLLNVNRIGEDDVSEDAGVDYLETVHAELNQFFERVVAQLRAKGKLP